MKGRLFIVALVAAVMVACTTGPEMQVQVKTCAPMPAPRASAVCFVVNDKAYVFAGRDSTEKRMNDLWQYDPVTDSWTDLGQAPLSARVNPTAVVQGDKVYLGLGFCGKHGKDSSYLRSWWEYTPETNTWRALADYPNYYTDACTAFAGDGELYVGYGFNWNYRRDMFRYDIATDRWDSIDVGVGMFDYPTRSFGGTGCTCQNRHFMGTGYYRFSLDWWAELVDGTRWEKRTEVPGPTRTLAACSASKDFIYVSGGIHYGSTTTTGKVLNDIRRYDPQTDRWTYMAQLPEGLMNHISFTIGKTVYIGLGETEEWTINNQLYRFEE